MTGLTRFAVCPGAHAAREVKFIMMRVLSGIGHPEDLGILQKARAPILNHLPPMLITSLGASGF